MKTLAVASLPVALLLQHHHLPLKSGQDRKCWWLWGSVVVVTEMNMLPPEEIPFSWNRLKNSFFSNQVSLACRSAVQGYRGSHCFFFTLPLICLCIYVFSMMKHESFSVFVVMVLYDKYTAHIFFDRRRWEKHWSSIKLRNSMAPSPFSRRFIGHDDEI